MRNTRILAALGLLATAAAANAEVSATAAIVSDYDFRGMTQTSEEPAIQLSIDYAHESGWYIGTWGSKIDDFSDGGNNTASTEVDIYTGFTGTVGDFGWDAGITYYMYNGASDLNFPEIYGKFSVGIVGFGLYYSNAFAHKDNDDAVYLYGDVGIPAGPVSIDLHVGYSTGDGIEQAYCGTFDPIDGCSAGVFAAPEDSYFDYSVGLTYTASNFTLGMKWIGVDANDGGTDDRIVLALSTSFPWN